MTQLVIGATLDNTVTRQLNSTDGRRAPGTPGIGDGVRYPCVIAPVDAYIHAQDTQKIIFNLHS